MKCARVDTSLYPWIGSSNLSTTHAHDPLQGMVVRSRRTRVRAMWTAGLRRGRERNETMRYLESSPKEYERVLRIIEEARAQGHEPMPMRRVKQPFDYDRR